MKKTLLLFLFAALPFSAQAAFDDVAADSPYADAINYLQENELVEGFADNTYRPDQTISRAEFTKILLLSNFAAKDILECNTSEFSDVAEDAWYLSYVCYAKENEIIKGYDDNTFGPDKTIIFAEAAKIIVNTLIEVQPGGIGEDWWRPFVATLAKAKATPPTIEAATQQITRGEMAEIIYRLKAEKEETGEKIFDGQNQDDEEENTENMTKYTSEKNAVSFAYKNDNASLKIFEDGSHVILATSELKTKDFDACVETTYCSEIDETQYEHLDSLYVLTKTKDDTDFETSILNKIAAAGKDVSQCKVVIADEAPEGWTKATVEPTEFETFVIDDEGVAYDNDDVELSKNEMQQLREKEAVEKCSNYAGGFGGSFFLFSEEKSPKYYLFAPSYGDTERLIDYESVEF